MYSLDRAWFLYCLQTCLYDVSIGNLAATSSSIALACFLSNYDRDMQYDRYVNANGDAIDRRVAIVNAARGSFAGGVNYATQSRNGSNGN